jgi:hypothetical protein
MVANLTFAHRVFLLGEIYPAASTASLYSAVPFYPLCLSLKKYSKRGVKTITPD